MNNTTLYRKYRPTKFSDVVGQDHIVNTLENEILSNKISHAYLFCGTRGTGKTTVAKIFARAVNCEHLMENGDPCNDCDSCKDLINNTVTDVIEIDAASNNGVEHVRSLRSEVQYTPSSSKYRVYIIDEVHMMTPSAFNALLKTLEEPPSHVIFILATTEAHKVPMTVQSRCQRFDFRRISNKDISENLLKIAKLDGFNLATDAAGLIATLSDGAMRDALSILNQCKSAASGATALGGEVTADVVRQTLGVSGREKYFQLAKAIASGDIGEALVASNEIIQKSGDAMTLANTLLEHFRELAVCKNVGEPSTVLDQSAEVIAELQEQAKTFSNEKIISCMQKLCEIIATAKVVTSPRSLVESGIVTMTGEI